MIPYLIEPNGPDRKWAIEEVIAISEALAEYVRNGVKTGATPDE